LTNQNAGENNLNVNLIRKKSQFETYPARPQKENFPEKK